MPFLGGGRGGDGSWEKGGGGQQRRVHIPEMVKNDRKRVRKEKVKE